MLTFTPNHVETLGRYTLQQKLAVGGMAEVWLARAEGPGPFARSVVVKRVLEHLATEPRFLEMFQHEARLVAQLDHPHIVQVFDFGEHNGVPYLAMEYVDGPSLKALLKACKGSGRTVPFPVAARLVAQACEGLAYAHGARGHDTGQPLGLVHRDVSPDNLLLTRAGIAKVSDFGIARSAVQRHRTKTGTVKGKLAYMSPEQLRAEPLDCRADVYSLGVVLYELLTLARPFDAKGTAELMRAVVGSPIVPVRVRRGDVPLQLARLAERALEKDRERRFADCREMQQALEAWLLGVGTPVSAWDVAAWLREVDTAEVPGSPGPEPGEVTAGAATPVPEAPPRAAGANLSRGRWAAVSGLLAVLAVAGWLAAGARKAGDLDVAGPSPVREEVRPSDSAAWQAVNPPAATPCLVRGELALPRGAARVQLRAVDGDGREVQLEWDGGGRFEAAAGCGNVVRLTAEFKGRHLTLWTGTAPAESLRLTVPALDAPGLLEVQVTGDSGPVRGATVAVIPELKDYRVEDLLAPPVTTNAAGVATRKGILPGSYRITVKARGHASWEQRHTDVSGPLTRVPVVLQRGQRLTGRLVDERGRGIANVAVEAQALDEDGHEVGAAEVEETGPGGAFTFRIALAPRVRLEAQPGEGWLNPGPLTVRPDQGAVMLTLRSPLLIRGRVLGWNGSPLPYFEVEGAEFESPGGRFSMWLPTLELPTVTAPGHEPRTLRPPERGGDFGDIRLEKSASVQAGRVLDEQGRPVAGARVTGEDCRESSVTDGLGQFLLGSGCTQVSARRGPMRGRVLQGGEGDLPAITLRPPARLQAVAYGANGEPEAHSTWTLDCENGDELPMEVTADAQGGIQLDLPQEACSLTPRRAGGTGTAAGTLHFRVGRGGARLMLGNAPGTSAVTLRMPPNAGRVHVTTLPPSEQAWSGEPAGDEMVMSGLAAGSYTATWLDRQTGRRVAERTFSAPTTVPVSPFSP